MSENIRSTPQSDSPFLGDDEQGAGSRRLPPRLPKLPRHYTGGACAAPTVAVHKRKRGRPSLNLSTFSSEPLCGHLARWSDVLVIVKPETDQTASGGFSPVLALAILVLRRPAEGMRRDSDSHPYCDDRELRLGRAEYSWELGKLGFEVSEPRLPDILDGCGHIAGSSQTLVVVPGQSSRNDLRVLTSLPCPV
jgi:hypothetical protein